MKNEIVPLLKSVMVVVVGVLIANYVQTTLMAKPTTTPTNAM
jgi:hypothetical protein